MYWPRCLSARSKLSGSDKSGSRAARGPESAATPPAPPHAGGSAADTAGRGAADKPQSLPHLEKGRRRLPPNHALERWICALRSVTDDFHHVQLEFAAQHVQSVGQAASHHLQVLLCVVRKAQPHVPVLLCGHGQRPGGNSRRGQKRPPLPSRPWGQQEDAASPDEAAQGKVVGEAQ